MHTSSTGERSSSDRTARIRRVVRDALQRRLHGETLPDETILSQHPLLLPELEQELAKLRHIHSALDQIEQDRCSEALSRIQQDWVCDGVATGGSSQSSPMRGSRSASSGARTRPFEGDSAAEGTTPFREDEASSNVVLSGGNGSSVLGDSPSDTPLPSTIGRYEVRRILGEGAFGRVYLAWDEELARKVAIKVPHRHRGSSSRYVATYLAEARVVAGLDHPAIVPVYDAGRLENGSCYVVSKLIPGTDLSMHVRDDGMSFSEAARIVCAIAEALQHAHSHGLVHRDVKPANILLDRANRPYLSDFGLALKDEDFGEGRSFAGTPAYMSPEQARGESHRVDARSDIFSLGVVLYELLTRRRPFHAEAYEELLNQVVWSDPRPPRQTSASIPEELERICLKALSKRAVDRYATAQDLVDDLRHFLESGSFSSVRFGSSSSTAHPTMRIVPKGLRPFDANDADFFLQLVPGPRDRNGVPESIRHWKHLVEQRDPDESFSVGVLYGPSGCGKSSLLRAGLLPRLAAHVHGLYVESTADDTESRLLTRLHRQYEDLPEHADIAECLAAVRRGAGPLRHQKLLLVLDQFEQWIHGKSEADRRMLVQALRQCDGSRLQCLLLVRDDFWLALSRFMAEIEVELVQGHNTALVDLFDPSHATNVLAEFGRAFGQLPENLAERDANQEAFLTKAVSSLSQEDKVVPVRLALFAEMVKSRSWSPATLRQVGGAAGVGVTFLDETFCARSANPRHRVHEPAARAVLSALLPESSSDIKGRIRSYPELLELSSYANRPRQFKELMRILDSETRLLTPTDAEIVEPDRRPTTPGQRYYQLTHDYLVPSLREWLREKQKLTHAGRTELRLEERATMWNARPERRQLPSIWEWVAIRTLTRPSLWTAPQRRMMQIAARYHAFALSCVFLVLFLFLFTGVELMASARGLLMNLRARTALLLVALGQDDTVWPLLKHTPDPSSRTRVIHGLSPVVLAPEDLLQRLQEEDDVSVRRAILLVMGEIVGDPEERAGTPAELRLADTSQTVIQQLVRIFQDDPDPGIHAAAEWVLRRYAQDDQVTRLTMQLRASEPRGDFQWYVNVQDHTMVVIPGYTQFQMGSPENDPHHREDERLHIRRISRSYCLASHETTVGQFRAFLRENPQIASSGDTRFDGQTASPQTNVRWYEAAAYCNWLSRRHGLPQRECCYRPATNDRYAATMVIDPNYANLDGYRLPTEAEWEYACRAHALTPRFYGNSESHLPAYAVYGRSDQPGLVGGRKPNDFGLFDMHGNVWEWCQDRYQPYAASNASGRTTRAPNRGTVLDGDPRVLRSGSFRDGPVELRSAARGNELPDVRSDGNGFRVARSYR